MLSVASSGPCMILRCLVAVGAAVQLLLCSEMHITMQDGPVLMPMDLSPSAV